MPDPATFAWSPEIAVGLGVLAGLAAVRSWRLAGVLAGAALLVQALGWAVVFTAVEVREHGWDEDWQVALNAGFLWGLLVAFPYTIIGAVVSAGLANWLRWRATRRRLR